MKQEDSSLLDLEREYNLWWWQTEAEIAGEAGALAVWDEFRLLPCWTKTEQEEMRDVVLRVTTPEWSS